MTKNISLKLSTVALAVLLASCGGGGSEGYFNKEGSSNGTTTGGSTTGGSTTTPGETAPSASSLKIELSKLSMAASNDSITVIVRALDDNKGGVANTNLVLKVIDLTNNVAIEGASSGVTDASGNVTFVLKTPAVAKNIQDLIKNGFTIQAQTKDGKLVQEQTVTVTGDQNSSADTTSIVLFEATKAALNVRGDETTLTLTAVDANGAVLANQAITLKVLDVAKNGVKFVPKATQTDANGQIKYTLQLSEGARNASYTAAQFVTDDLNLEANFGQSTTIYKYKINVVDSDVPTPVGAITVAYNPTKIEDSATGVYYYKNVSVQVNDIDGKPIANQEVTMGVNPLVYYKGHFSFVDTSDPADGKADEYLQLNAYSCTSPSQLVNLDGEVVSQLKPKNGKSVQVVSYINSEGTAATDNKYRTDANGRFDLKIQYPKIYAGWLNVQLTAKTNVSNQLIKGSTTVGLSYLLSDVDVGNLIAPNKNSPFGDSSDCSSPD
ncbi:Ig-like domain-containing protein [Acinetobacter bouvetii]|uniref:Bacterial Ig-like domain (Group 1) n=1 Tax=Acinetobacter bouvetii TaxID=202951 RepID=A0A811GGB5_9GAMM|nr:Ig-like domain-containing protein [Acinetobacter bouvetii]CAB1218069.1 Bacterial Ig-like domain (group 1) [Acinetobacter bouvetii]